MDGYDKKYYIRNIQLGGMEGWMGLGWNIQLGLELDTKGVAVYIVFKKLPNDKSFSIPQWFIFSCVAVLVGAGHGHNKSVNFFFFFKEKKRKTQLKFSNSHVQSIAKKYGKNMAKMLLWTINFVFENSFFFFFFWQVMNYYHGTVI
jgi:hypothetical protein